MTRPSFNTTNPSVERLAARLNERAKEQIRLQSLEGPPQSPGVIFVPGMVNAPEEPEPDTRGLLSSLAALLDRFGSRRTGRKKNSREKGENIMNDKCSCGCQSTKNEPCNCSLDPQEASAEFTIDPVLAEFIKARYDEIITAIRALKINPHYPKAWVCFGTSLGTLAGACLGTDVRLPALVLTSEQDRFLDALMSQWLAFADALAQGQNPFAEIEIPATEEATVN